MTDNEHCGKWEWDASRFDEIAVRIYQDGGSTKWFRNLHSSGSTSWHKIVLHPDGSALYHWLCDNQEFFAAYVRAVEASAVSVGESPFADQELYDDLRDRYGDAAGDSTEGCLE